MGNVVVNESLPRSAGETANFDAVVAITRNTTQPGTWVRDISQLAGLPGGSLPVLWLVDDVASPIPPDFSVQPVQLPIPLERLAQFVSNPAEFAKPARAAA